MKGQLILCESATVHPDGTFSLLRGAINNFSASAFPAPFDATLVILIESDIADEGAHKIDVRCMDEDGGSFGGMNGEFMVPQGGGRCTLISHMSMKVEKPGTFKYYLRIDNVQMDDCTLNARETNNDDRGHEHEGG